ncbi:carboxypeptidase M32 [Filimonas effusa]|uniref:Metal-dependent carboxypeptidase n=1 Tax=Filimonas effusa TaxID=2508721 RepID=A0A4Q1D5C4_9BACT|nr:carboxypeptidase M32 [Filimonas effusa]RXK82841.1 carboxypeptidase M32 [Filimonas effusa]
MMIASDSLYQQYSDHMRRVADLRYAAAVLQWDQETYMPQKGAGARARQLATLSETAHEWATAAAFEKLVYELQQRGDLNAVQQRNIALSYDELVRRKKLSAAFVRRSSEAVSRAFQSWIAARKANDFKLFQSSLSELVGLKAEEADLLGYEGHPYNALIYEYERSASVKSLDALFGALMPALQQLIDAVRQQPEPDTSFLQQNYPKEQQWKWGMYLVKELGFDLEAGRQDLSEHPFTTNFSAKDVRITTRIDENDLANMTWSCIHEVGHALYEQGLPNEEYGLPSGEYASLSIHESQSRLWENCVGRSLVFWQHYLPELKRFFPEQLKEVDPERFFRGINKVEPSLIRTEADELTYHSHVYIRYVIEKELISRELPVKEVAARWNELYRDHLGVTVKDDVTGCLQDVHWSHGSFGYFPTYSLGSLYAAQFWHQAQQVMPALNSQLNNVQLAGLLKWLRTEIHAKGRTLETEALCREVTGEGLDSRFFVGYIRQKFMLP